MKKELAEFGYDRDMTWYLTPKNIPNQDLIKSVQGYFTNGEGSCIWDAPTALNLGYCQRDDIYRHPLVAEDALNRIKQIPLNADEYRLLLALILKLGGGYPVNYLDDEQQAVMLAIEKEFLASSPQKSELEFAHRDEEMANLFMKLGITGTTAIRTGESWNDIWARMEHKSAVDVEKPFTTFDEMFKGAEEDGILGVISNSFDRAVLLSDLNFGFNIWLADYKGWDKVDPQFYDASLTASNFGEYLKIREQEREREKINGKSEAEKRKQRWGIPPLTEELISEKEVKKSVENPKTELIPANQVFVTYSWDGDDHQKNVMGLTRSLRDHGENATMDIKAMQEETATHFKAMMNRNLLYSHKIIVVLSSGYKSKAEMEQGGVDYEYRYICQDLKDSPNKYILVTLGAISDKVIPSAFKGMFIQKLENQEDFVMLLRLIRNEHKYIFPEVASMKPELKSIEVAPLFPQHKEDISITSVIGIISISEERLLTSQLPQDENWVLRGSGENCHNVYIRVWLNRAEKRRTKWISVPPLEKDSYKEACWIRSCSAIEVVWTDAMQTNFRLLTVENRRSTILDISKEQFIELIELIGSNCDFLNRAMVEMINREKIDVTKMSDNFYINFLAQNKIYLT